MDFVGKTITGPGSGAEKTIDVRSTTTILDVTITVQVHIDFLHITELKTIKTLYKTSSNNCI